MNEPQLNDANKNKTMNQPRVNYANEIKTAFDGVTFPTTKAQLIQSKGTARVDVAMGKNVSVREALEPIRTDRFETREALLNEISTAHSLGWPAQ